MIYLGDFPTGATIYIPFHTFSSDDPSASMTITGLATTDIEIYKNGSTTQRSSDAGYSLLDTDGIDFDGITGIHGISIDTSDNTDTGFYAVGADYWVVISSITLDGATINFVVGIFSIDNRGLLRPTTVQRTLDVTATGAAGIDWGNIENKTTANNLSATDIQLCDTVTTLTGHTVQTGDSYARIGATGSGLTTLATAAGLGTAQTDLDTITGTGGVLIATEAMDRSATLSVNTKTMTDGVITAAKLGSDCITEAKIANDAIASEHIATGAVTADAFAADAIVAATLATDSISADALAADAIAEINATVDTALGDYDAPTKAELDSAFTEIKGATWAAGTDTLEHIRNKAGDIETDTQSLQNNIGTAGDGLTDLGGMSTAMTNAVNAEVDTALSDIKLDHLISAAAAEDEVTDNSIIARLAATEGDWSEFSDESHSLEAIRVRGDSDWSSGAAANPNMILEAEIATVNSQTEIELATGADFDNAYNDQTIIIYDNSNNDYPSVRVVNDYDAVDKTLTLDSGPDFTMAADDSIKIFATAPGTSAPTVGQIRTEIDSNSTQLADIVTSVADIPTVAEFNARSIPSTDYVVTTDTIAGVTLVATTTNLTNAPTSGDFTTTMKASINTECDTALSDYGANTTTPPTVGEIQAEMEENGASILDTLRDDLINGGRLDLLIDAIKERTDNLPDDPADDSDIDTQLVTISGKIDAVDNFVDTEITAIKDVTDALPNAGALTDIDTGINNLETRLSAARAGYLDELAAGNLIADVAAVKVDTAAIKLKTDNLPGAVPKNVALSNFPFLMVDSTDHVTAKTGLTVTAQISQDGAGFGACSNSVTAIGSGMYKISLTQSEMNADLVTLKFTAVGGDQRIVVIKTDT